MSGNEKRESDRLDRRLLVAGAVIVVLAVLGLALPLTESVVPDAALYGSVTGGLLVMGLALVMGRRARQRRGL